MPKRNLNDLTESEINAIIFKDARVDEPRGIRDALTDREVLSLPHHPAWDCFSLPFQSWVWNAIDSIYIEEGY